MCESSSASPSFSSERSCRRKLVYRDVVLVRRLFKYDDMLRRARQSGFVSVNRRPGERQAVETPLFGARSTSTAWWGCTSNQVLRELFPLARRSPNTDHLGSFKREELSSRFLNARCYAVIHPLASFRMPTVYS